MTPERWNRIVEVLALRQPDLTVLVEKVHKVHNLSAILRTCDAVGVLEVHAVVPRHGLPSLESSAGEATSSSAHKWVPLHPYDQSAQALQALKDRGFRLFAAHFSATAVDFRQPDYAQPTCIVLGTEKWGISPEVAQQVDQHIIIPMAGMVQSLNVSVAAATILYEAQRQRQAAGRYATPQLEAAQLARLQFEWAYPDWAERLRQEGRPYPVLDPQTGAWSSD